MYLYRATLYKISIRFTSVFPGYRTSSFQYQLNSLGSIQTCCHHGAGNKSNTQAITVQPGTHSLLGRESAHTGEVSCPRTQRHTAAAETRTQDLSVLSRRPWSRRHDALHVYGVYILNLGTLRVVTVRELVVLSGSVATHSKSQSDGTAIYVVMRATRDTQSPKLKGEK